MDLIAHLLALVVTLGQGAPSPAAPAADLVVEKAGRGEAAAVLFYSELSAHIADGYSVTSMQRLDDGVIVELVGAEVVVLEAITDELGRVRQTEVSSRPRVAADTAANAWPAEQHLAADSLARASSAATVRLEDLADGPALMVDDAEGPIAVVRLGVIEGEVFHD